MTLNDLLCLCGVTISDSDACREDSLHQSFKSLGESMTIPSSFPEEPDEAWLLLGLSMSSSTQMLPAGPGPCGCQPPHS